MCMYSYIYIKRDNHIIYIYIVCGTLKDRGVYIYMKI